MFNDDMAMEDILYPSLASDCMDDTIDMDFDPEEEEEEEEEEEVDG